MSPPRSRAIAALERWRRFEEARLATVHRAAQREALRAGEESRRTHDLAALAQSQRSALLAAPALDLARWHTAAAIEDALWQQAEHCGHLLADAEREATRAMRAHRDAHALTGVARQRRERFGRQADEAAEKTESDRLADLRASTTRTKP